MVFLYEFISSSKAFSSPFVAFESNLLNSFSQLLSKKPYYQLLSMLDFIIIVVSFLKMV